MRTRNLGLFALAAGAVMAASTAQAYTLLTSKWTTGGNAATAMAGNHPTPGAASWSIMGAGLGFTGFETHAGDVTNSFGSLIGGATTAEEIAAITTCFATWSSVCAFHSLGMVADGGVAGGASEASGGHLGDIRFASVDGGFDGAFGVLAHAYQPGTEAYFGAGGTIAGDVHFDTAETWADDPTDTTADGDFDFHTVALHEIGHALGLGHSSDPTSVMYAFYGGARRSLTADDIAGIRDVYGIVPEPGTIAVLGLGALALMRRRRSR